MDNYYWALDYVGDDECELVFRDQLYQTEEDAERARQQLNRPDDYEVHWYGLLDLMEIYDGFVSISPDLSVVVS